MKLTGSIARGLRYVMAVAVSCPCSVAKYIGLTWFTYIWTLGYFAYLLVAIIYKPAFYNYWAHL